MAAKTFNKYYEIYQSHKSRGRGPIFDFVTRTFSGPMKILEIGSIRDLSEGAVGGDGWSTFWWADYILKNGGELTVVDINARAIENCQTALSDFVDKIPVNFHIGDGLPFISDSYDFIYLDGSDCPREMLNQFVGIDRSKTRVLCDDFHSKGVMLMGESGKPLDEPFDYWEASVREFENLTLLSVPNGEPGGHRMAFYNKK